MSKELAFVAQLYLFEPREASTLTWAYATPTSYVIRRNSTLSWTRGRTLLKASDYSL